MSIQTLATDVEMARRAVDVAVGCENVLDALYEAHWDARDALPTGMDAESSAARLAWNRRSILEGKVTRAAWRSVRLARKRLKDAKAALAAAAAAA